jgi:hypothetical protein
MVTKTYRRITLQVSALQKFTLHTYMYDVKYDRQMHTIEFISD